MLNSNINNPLSIKKQKKIGLSGQIFFACVIGVAYGMFLPDFLDYVTWMGELFIRILRMVTVPLICTTIISGMSQILSSENFNRLGLKTLLYYAVTSVLATMVALILVNIIKPGLNFDIAASKAIENLNLNKESYLSVFKIIPHNIFESLVNGNLLPIIFFSLFFGYFIVKLDDKQRVFMTTFFNASSEVLMKIVKYLLKVAPFGVLGLAAKLTADNMNDYNKLFDNFLRLKWYFVTVILGLLIHGIVVLPLILRFIGKINPWKHFKAMISVLLTALSTVSSEATLPMTMLSVKNKSGVSNKISSIVLPFGTSININGTVLYECIAAMFIAQAYGFELNYYEQMLIMVTAMLATISSAGVPMSNLLMVSIILSAVGLPLEGLGLIFIVDKVIDMFKTTINVWSDTCCAAIIAKTEGEQLMY